MSNTGRVNPIAERLRERKKNWIEAIEAMEAGATEIDRLQDELDRSRALLTVILHTENIPR